MSSSSRDGGDECVGDESPRPVRSGIGKFRFNLVESNAQCINKNDDLYEWGQFEVKVCTLLSHSVLDRE